MLKVALLIGAAVLALSGAKPAFRKKAVVDRYLKQHGDDEKPKKKAEAEKAMTKHLAKTAHSNVLKAARDLNATLHAAVHAETKEMEAKKAPKTEETNKDQESKKEVHKDEAHKKTKKDTKKETKKEANHQEAKKEAKHEAKHEEAKKAEKKTDAPEKKDKKAPANPKLSRPVATSSKSDAIAFHNVTAWYKSKSGAPGPAPGPGPAPAPVPAPLTYEQQVAKMKSDMMTKIKGDSFDADLVIERPNKVKPGEGTGKEHPVPEFKDIGNDKGPYAAPAPGLKHDDISFKSVGALPTDAQHVNRETMTSDWHMEYGPNGPAGTHGTSPTAGQSFKILPAR